MAGENGQTASESATKWNFEALDDEDRYYDDRDLLYSERHGGALTSRTLEDFSFPPLMEDPIRPEERKFVAELAVRMARDLKAGKWD